MEGKPLSGVQYQQDMTIYPEPNEIVLQLGHRDVVLNFFKDKKARILSLQSGEKLYPDGAYLLNEDDGVRQRIVKLSQSAQEQLESLTKKGYRVLRAEVGYVAAWKSDDDAKEHAVVLPTLYLGK